MTISIKFGKKAHDNTRCASRAAGFAMLYRAEGHDKPVVYEKGGVSYTVKVNKTKTTTTVTVG